MRRLLLVIAVLPMLGACAVGDSAETEPPESLPAMAAAGPADPPPGLASLGGTLILDQAAADRLLRADGVTLQWISWDRRGTVAIGSEGGVIRLTARQEQADGPGRLFLDGLVREIGADYFIFDGTIRITDAPGVGRACEADKLWHFGVTQNRRYWRLREFEWCDGLTDYVDIYF